MSEQKFRVESDLLGELQVPAEAYYGVQTQRGINNYHISRKKMRDYPEFVNAIAYVKLAAVQANHSLGVIMGHQKGEYQYCYPNDHCNCGQSTNDVYPTTIRLTFILLNKRLVESLTRMINALRDKGEEYKNTIKMGRTQLQDAVPMTSGQEFNAFANNMEEEILNLERNVKLLHEINMGGTAIGTGLNAVPGFAKLCTENLAKLTGEPFTVSPDLVEATPDTEIGRAHV